MNFPDKTCTATNVFRAVLVLSFPNRNVAFQYDHNHSMVQMKQKLENSHKQIDALTSQGRPAAEEIFPIEEPK